MAWDQQVPGCFGVQDLIFAGHAMDLARAFEWLTDLRERHVGWKDALGQLEEFLKSKGASSDHIERQLQRAKARMEPWLHD